MVYTTHTEDFVQAFYQRIGITEPQQLDFRVIAEQIGLHVYYWPHASQALFLKGHAYIFLNENLTPQQQWQDFCHELAHVLLHVGNQLHLPKSFVEYQEHKANNFMYHACVPSFMLRDMQLPYDTKTAVWEVQEAFGVERAFAEKRLQQYTNNQQAYAMERMDQHEQNKMDVHTGSYPTPEKSKRCADQYSSF